MPNRTEKNQKVIRILKASEKEILNYLAQVIIDNKFDYRTFGTAIENYLSEIIIAVFKKTGYITSKNDYALAPNKNYFPDFELKTKKPIAIEFKSGNRSQYRNGKWVAVKNSENDMGTIGEWMNKINKFGGDNIIYIFVTYNFNDKEQKIINVEIEPFYKFIGINTANVLKYREKDGNLRPKDFDLKSPIKTLDQFVQLINKTKFYRSDRIIKKHQAIIKGLPKEAKTK